MTDNDAAKALDRLESDLDKLLTAIPRTAYDDFGTIAGAAKADIDYIRETLTKSAKVDELLEALKPFANVADRIKEHATDNRWLEQCLFSMGDDADPLKWSLTGKAFNDASCAIQRFNGEG